MPENSQNNEPKKKSIPTFSQEAKLSAVSDLFFVLLPFVVIFIVLAFRGHLNDLFSISEWSIATPVVAGQGIARVVSVAVNRSVVREGIVFMVTLAIVLLLVPSLIVL